MIETFKEDFDDLGIKFGRIFTDGGMVLDVFPFDKKPTFEDLVDFFRKKGYTDEGLKDLIYIEITHNQVIKEITNFYEKPNVGYDSKEIEEICSKFINLSNYEIIKIQEIHDQDCFSLTYLINIEDRFYVFDLWWQYD